MPATRPLPVTGAAPTTRPLPLPVPAPVPAGRPRARRRRGLLVALLLAGALLASLPALAGGLPLLVRERVQSPFAVLDPRTAGSTTGEPQEPVATDDTDAAPGPGPAPADEAGPSSFADPGADSDRQSDPGDDDRDRDDRDRDDDSSGSGRSGGGDSGGGSSGPG